MLFAAHHRICGGTISEEDKKARYCVMQRTDAEASRIVFPDASVPDPYPYKPYDIIESPHNSKKQRLSAYETGTYLGAYRNG
jgi:hypothetical protein